MSSKREITALSVAGVIFSGSVLWGLTPGDFQPVEFPTAQAFPRVTEQPDAGVAVPESTEPKPHPLADLTREDIALLVSSDMKSLGPLSVGLPNRGALFNPVAMPDGPYWTVVNPDYRFGTQETVDAMVAAISAVNERFPRSPKLFIGHLSKPGGGYLKPHRSHQSGRDVDVGYYYRGKAKWYQRATAANLDLPRTWTLIKALFTVSEVEYIFMDRSIEKLVFDYALTHGEDLRWLEKKFEGTPGARDSVVRHTWGHQTHFHVRFASPIARESAWRAYPALLKQRRLSHGGYYGRGATSWR